MIIRAPQEPVARLNRLRRSAGLRELVRETRLHPSDLVEPVFVVEAERDAGPIESMPGVVRESLGSLPARIRQIRSSGIRSVILFGVPAEKDSRGSSASAEDGVIPRAIQIAKGAAPDIVVMTDVCLCQYTSHGHCGVLCGHALDLDASLNAITATALAHARAGAEVVAPSAMLDGVVSAIRRNLDAHGYDDTAILAYAIKHASAFYGPFRDAADSTPSFGDRRAHQMDPANGREAIREALQDIHEGADAVMIKPGMPALDLITDLKGQAGGRPVAAYQVSGEYAMITAAAQNGWIDERGAVLESLTAFKRAGADFILSYWASRAANWIKEDSR